MERVRAIVINMMANIEDLDIPFFGKIFDGMTDVTENTMKLLKEDSLAANAKDANVPGMAPDLQVNDFTIRTHPKDTLVMAGGTNIDKGSSDEKLLRNMQDQRMTELIRVSKENRVFAYNKFDASKSSVYTTKFS